MDESFETCLIFYLVYVVQSGEFTSGTNNTTSVTSIICNFCVEILLHSFRREGIVDNT